MSLLLRGLLRAVRAEPGRALALAGLIAAAVSVYGGTFLGLGRLKDSADLLAGEQHLHALRLGFEVRPRGGLPSAETLSDGAPALLRLRVLGHLRRSETDVPVPAMLQVLSPEGLVVDTPRIVEGEALAATDPTGVLLDLDFARRAGLRPGDALRVGLPGQEVVAKIRGIAAFPELPVPLLHETVFMPAPGSVAMVVASDTLALMTLGYSPVNELVVAGEAPEAALRGRLAEAGVTVLAVRRGADEPAVAWNAGRLRALEDFLPTVVAVYVGLIFLVQTLFVGRMLAAARNELGMLRALGFSTGQLVLRWTVAGLAGPALGVALGVGGALGLGAAVTTSYVEGTGFPLLLAPEDVQPVLEAVLLAAGSVVPATAWPMVRLLRTPIAGLRTEPLDTQRNGVFLRLAAAFDRRLAGLWGFALRLGPRNLVRRPGVSLSALACACGVMVLAASLFAFNRGIHVELDRYFAAQQWDLAFDLHAPASAAEVEGWLGPGLAWTGARRVDGSVSAAGRVAPSSVLGEPLDGELRGTPLIAGRAPVDREVVLDQRQAEALGVALGDVVRVAVGDHAAELRLVGLANNLEVGQAWVVSEVLASLVADPAAINRVFVRTEDPLTLARSLADRPEVSAVLRRAPLEQAVAGMTRLFGDMLVFGAWLASVSGSAVAATLVLLAVRERGRETALLLTLGYAPRSVAAGIALEVGLLAGSAALLALPLSAVLCRVFQMRLASAAFWVPVEVEPGRWLLSMAPAALGMFVAVPVAFGRVRRTAAAAVLGGRG